MRFRFNHYREEPRFDPVDRKAVRAFHRSFEEYALTPLHQCPALASSLGLAGVYVKDESDRFGLNSFKVLGASWAMHKFISSHARPAAFSAATDGNHGRAVAWMARRLGCPAVIFVPENTVPARIEALHGDGARVEVVRGNYDATVLQCVAQSKAQGWQVISDTGYTGFHEIPHHVVEGFGTLYEEAEEQIAERGLRPPTMLFVQAGVGGLASAAVQRLKSRRGGPFLVSVEPVDADCMLESISSPGGEPRTARGRLHSIMAGLNCGEVSQSAWPLNRAGIDLFLAIEDRYAEDAMRRFYHPAPPDPRIISGESGAAGLAGLLALCLDERLREARDATPLGLDSVVLLINTEGATDPESFRRIVRA